MALSEIADIAIPSADSAATQVEEEFKANKVKKSAALKEPKPKKASASKGSNAPPSHPSYYEMIVEAINARKDRKATSQYAIAKFMEDRRKNQLPSNFRKLLLVQLRKLVSQGKLTQIKNSFKLPIAEKAAKPAIALKKPTFSSKLKAPNAAVKPKLNTAGAVRPKLKASKPEAATVKKPATAVVKKPAAKMAKTSAKGSPAAKKPVNKMVAKMSSTAKVVKARKPKIVRAEKPKKAMVSKKGAK